MMSVLSLAEPLATSDFIQGIQKEASSCSVWVSIGVHEAPPISSTDKRCWNTQCLIDPQGRIIDAYKKLHLFDVDIKGGITILESNTTRKGDELPKVTDTDVGKGVLDIYECDMLRKTLILALFFDSGHAYLLRSSFS